MFYSDNLLLSVLARSCKEIAVVVTDAYMIFLYLICCTWTAPVLRMFSGTVLLLLLICKLNAVLVFLILVFTFQFVVYVLMVVFRSLF